MGGKLFNLGRLPKKDYSEIEAQVKKYLDNKIPNSYRIPQYYRDKADFGDMDIIISPELAGKEWHILRQEITQDLDITQFKVVGNVFSTVYQHLQVDFFTAPALYLESTYNYLSFNDLGNLIGRICKRFELKYGEQGLLYVYRQAQGNYQKDLPITTDMGRICAFLGLDYPRWRRGFDNLADLFEWVIASPYFSVEPYLNPSKTIDKRAKHRPTIERFLAYLTTHNIEKRYVFEEDKSAYLPSIITFFPESDLAYQIAQEQAREAYMMEVQVKFNGKHIMSLIPDLNGIALGKFILSFKQQFVDNEQFESYLIQNPQKIIDEKIIALQKITRLE